MKKIAIFTGAGVSQESGVSTFRDTKDGLWYNYNVDEVATRRGWLLNPEKVMEFHNMLRKKLLDVQPNDAHKALAKLQDKYDVTIVTQNVDDLHERAGSNKVLHLHGELFKSRSTLDPKTLYECRGDLNVGDEGADGSRLRPHTVLFDEYPYNVDESWDVLSGADILIIIGTSFDISYTAGLVGSFKGSAVYYVDPKPTKLIENYFPVKFIRKKAVEGVTKLVDKLLKEKE